MNLLPCCQVGGVQKIVRIFVGLIANINHNRRHEELLRGKFVHGNLSGGEMIRSVQMCAGMLGHRKPARQNTILLQCGEDLVFEGRVTGARPVGILWIQRMSQVNHASLTCSDTFEQSRWFRLRLLTWLRCLAGREQKQKYQNGKLFHNFLMLVYLAVGSNIGDRQHYIRSAIQGLSARGVRTIRCASIYLTEPRDILDQPWFLNTVLEASTSLDPDQLLRACLEVEEENLRKRDRSKGPRTLDIDIIFFGREIIRMNNLEIPHPRFSKRRFVLEPLAEIAPEFVDPASGKTILQLLKEVSDPAQVERLR